MNIIEAMEQLKAGKQHQHFRGQIATGKNLILPIFQLYCLNFCVAPAGSLDGFSGDYDVKEEKETKDVKETEEAV